MVGATVGDVVGDVVGDTVGDTVGDAVGDAVGDTVGDAVGERVVGETVGETVGSKVGGGGGLNPTPVHELDAESEAPMHDVLSPPQRPHVSTRRPLRGMPSQPAQVTARGSCGSRSIRACT